MSDIFGDDDKNGKKKDDFGAMLEASLKGLEVKFSKGDKVEAEIMTIGKDDVFVNIKGKDGMVLKQELLDAEGQFKHKVGDQVTLYVVKNKDSIVQLTARASHQALSENMEDAVDFETPVEGKVTEVCNGGFRVQVFHKTAFCPISQMDLKQITSPEEYVGKKFEFIITKYEGGGRNIVVSRRKLLDVERLENEGSFIERTKVGSLLSGRVTRFEKFGAFVEIAPGIEGLVHISEIGWSRLEHPSEALNINDAIEIKVIKIEEDDRGRLKISLSRKQAGDDPWKETIKTLSVGQSIEGKIREKAHFGWFIEIRPGIVGLLPKSAMREATDEKAIEQKKVGETLHLQIASINADDRRISLSLPRDQDDTAWESFSLAGKDSKDMGTLGDQFSKLFGKK